MTQKHANFSTLSLSLLPIGVTAEDFAISFVAFGSLHGVVVEHGDGLEYKDELGKPLIVCIDCCKLVIISSNFQGRGDSTKIGGVSS